MPTNRLEAFSDGVLASLVEEAVPQTPTGRMAAMGCYVLVALMWLVPDRRFERDHASRDGAA